MVHRRLVGLEKDLESEAVAKGRIVLRSYQIWSSFLDIPASQLCVCDGCSCVAGSVSRVRSKARDGYLLRKHQHVEAVGINGYMSHAVCVHGEGLGVVVYATECMVEVEIEEFLERNSWPSC